MSRHHSTIGALIADTAQKLQFVPADAVDEAYREVLADIGSFFALDAAFIWHNDHATGVAKLLAKWPAPKCAAGPDPIRTATGNGIPGAASAEDPGEPTVVTLTAQSEEFKARTTPHSSAPDIISIAAVPLIAPTGDPSGTLELVRYYRHEWPAADLIGLKTIASVVAHVKVHTDYELEMKRLAEQDSLTGLWNRRKLLQHLERRLSTGAPGPVAVLYISPDRLRTVKSVLGHEAADQLMTHFCDHLQAHLGAGAFIARPDNDEIAVVLDEPTSHQHAEELARRLRDALHGQILIEPERISSSMSIAVAIGIPGEHSPSDLMSHAAHALSSIRAAGGNRIAGFRHDLAATFDLHTDIELNLHQAIENEQLVLFFQPEVDLHTGAIVALESLATWDHPTRGRLTSEQFMPVAEATNQAATLGRRILWLCCQQLHQWHEMHLAENMVMRIRLSPAQVLTENFVTYLVKTLDHFQLPAHALSLEFPQSDVFFDPAVSATLRGLKAAGVGLALADFGTGYSSLAGLKLLPFDTLRIDKSFVQLVPDDNNVAIVRSIWALSQAFDLHLVADGLQDYVSAEVLVGHGCRHAQGPLVSAPLDTEATTVLLKNPLIPRVDLGTIRDQARRARQHHAIGHTS